MTTGSIVESFDVGKNITFGFLPCCILAVMDEFCFQRVKEALHRGIVIAVGLAAHRGSEAGGLHHFAIVCRGILNAAIGMVDQAGARPLRRDRHPQGCQRQVGAQMIAHRPADDLATVEIQDRGQIEPALIGLDIGDVGKPDPVRRSGGEVAIEQVRGDRKS